MRSTNLLLLLLLLLLLYSFRDHSRLNLVTIPNISREEETMEITGARFFFTSW